MGFFCLTHCRLIEFCHLQGQVQEDQEELEEQEQEGEWDFEMGEVSFEWGHGGGLPGLEPEAQWMMPEEQDLDANPEVLYFIYALHKFTNRFIIRYLMTHLSYLKIRTQNLGKMN